MEKFRERFREAHWDILGTNKAKRVFLGLYVTLKDFQALYKGPRRSFGLTGSSYFDSLVERSALGHSNDSWGSEGLIVAFKTLNTLLSSLRLSWSRSYLSFGLWVKRSSWWLSWNYCSSKCISRVPYGFKRFIGDLKRHNSGIWDLDAPTLGLLCSLGHYIDSLSSEGLTGAFKRLDT